MDSLTCKKPSAETNKPMFFLFNFTQAIILRQLPLSKPLQLNVLLQNEFLIAIDCFLPHVVAVKIGEKLRFHINNVIMLK